MHTTQPSPSTDEPSTVRRQSSGLFQKIGLLVLVVFLGYIALTQSFSRASADTDPTAMNAELTEVMTEASGKLQTTRGNIGSVNVAIDELVAKRDSLLSEEALRKMTHFTSYCEVIAFRQANEIAIADTRFVKFCDTLKTDHSNLPEVMNGFYTEWFSEHTPSKPKTTVFTTEQ